MFIGMSQIAKTEKSREQKEIRTGCATDFDDMLVILRRLCKVIEPMVQSRQTQMNGGLIRICTD